LDEAKAHFDELFRRARAEGPQRVINRRGEAVVIVRAEELDEVRRPESLLDFFQSAPGGSGLDLQRKRDSSRTIRILRNSSAP
jgi:prevent-host-death family protein